MLIVLPEEFASTISRDEISLFSSWFCDYGSISKPPRIDIERLSSQHIASSKGSTRRIACDFIAFRPQCLSTSNRHTVQVFQLISKDTAAIAYNKANLSQKALGQVPFTTHAVIRKLFGTIGGIYLIGGKVPCS
ncbi:hypothetical protein DL98DRAFT_507863 [Cadophora sp. DSE1049]|nr:hypothetical protein DL98DRAFT_507863 [Cadophora sp. DSE1049]